MAIKCHLSTLMGKHKMSIQDVHKSTGLNRNTISNLYREKIKRIDFDTIDKLCKLFKCKIEELFEHKSSSEIPEEWFEPVTDEDVKFIEEKRKEFEGDTYMSDEDFFALLDEE